MENAFDTVIQAVREARELDRAIERQNYQLAELLETRLEKLPASALRRIKRKLQHFDSTKGYWK